MKLFSFRKAGTRILLRVGQKKATETTYLNGDSRHPGDLLHQTIVAVEKIAQVRQHYAADGYRLETPEEVATYQGKRSFRIVATIFQDPLTRMVPEGEAVLLKLQSKVGDDKELWTVRFLCDGKNGPIVTRFVNVAEKGLV